MELNPEHQQTADSTSEYIRQLFINGIAKRAIQAAEFIGRHYEPPYDYREDDEED